MSSLIPQTAGQVSCRIYDNSVLIETVKKLRWVVIASLGVLVACGSLLISRPGSPPRSERAVSVVRPAHPEKPSSVLSALGKRPSLEDVQDLYYQGQRQLYNSTRGEEYLRARELLQDAQALLAQLSDAISEIDRLYWQARLEFELGTWYQGAAWEDDSKAQEALPYYAAAEQLAVKLVQQAPNFSDGHRLLGETRMRIISLKSWFHALAGAGAARGALERALELDPRNAEARLALGVYYLYAPQPLGGSAERALLEFQHADSLTTGETVRFLLQRWQGVAYAKLGKIAEAREAFLKALTIYPKSAWDQNELRKLH